MGIGIGFSHGFFMIQYMDPGFSQRLLCPIHSRFSEILKRIPQDGTFNPVALVGRKPGMLLVRLDHCH